jgi:hypothetical protein
MVTDGPEARPIWKLTSPACRVICPAGTDEIKSVAVWSPERHRYWAVRPDAAELDVLRGFARQVADEIVASVRPAGGGGIGVAGVGAAGSSLPAEAAALAAEGAVLLPIVQELTEPRLLICRVVGVMAQIAAVHVGFPAGVARAIGQLAGSLASQFIEPEPESPGMRALQYADVTFSATGELTEYLGVGRVEVRSQAEAARRLSDLDRDRPAPGSRTTGIGRRRAYPLVERQAGRAARETLPGVGRRVQGSLPGVGRRVQGALPGEGQVAGGRLRGVGRAGPHRMPPDLPGRGHLPGRGDPPGRGGRPAR